MNITKSTAKLWLARVCTFGAVAAVATLSVVAPAQAAVADRFGFVLWNGSAVVGSGVWPAASTVTPGPPGRYTIDFVGQGITGGVMHITAINTAPHSCQISSFGPSGPDEIAQVACYKSTGVLDVSAFSAIFDRSSCAAAPPGKFGYVDSAASGAIISQFNSACAVNTVAHSGLGVWVVTMPGLATPGPIDGSIQATAVNPGVAARCKVASWTSGGGGQQITIDCYNAAGAPFDTEFTTTYQYQRSLYGPVAPPKYFGYLWYAPPVGPVSTNFNFPLGPGANSLGVSGVGLYVVKFPSLAMLPDNLEVTASGSGPSFCGLTSPWLHSGSDTVAESVNCFAPSGAPLNSGFLISDNSRA